MQMHAKVLLEVIQLLTCVYVHDCRPFSYAVATERPRTASAPFPLQGASAWQTS